MQGHLLALLGLTASALAVQKDLVFCVLSEEERAKCEVGSSSSPTT